MRPTCLEGIWRVSADADMYGRVKIRDLDFFRTHFVGKPMKSEWHNPTLAMVQKQPKHADFVSWAAGVLLCSARAKSVLEARLKDCVEWLPCHMASGELRFAINVIAMGDRFVDLHATDALNAGSSVAFLRPRIKFLPDAGRIAPPMFRLQLDAPAPYSSHYVNAEVAAVIASERLKGIDLMNPERDVARAYLRGESMNDYPGLKA